MELQMTNKMAASDKLVADNIAKERSSSNH